MKSKVCKWCSNAKDLSSFTVNKSSKDGLMAYCRACLKERHGYHKPEVKERHYKKYGKYDSYEEMLAARELRNANVKEIRKEMIRKYINSWGSGVYLITTVCNNTYVGFSQYLRKRRNVHNSNSLRPDSAIAGIYKIKEFKILENTDNKEREVYYIKKLKPSINQTNN